MSSIDIKRFVSTLIICIIFLIIIVYLSSPVVADSTTQSSVNCYDVDESGEFNIFDVQYMFDMYNSEGGQFEDPSYDFDEDGDIDIMDIQVLFEKLKDGDNSCPYSFKVDTTLNGETSDGSFKISTNDNLNYNYDVVWNEVNGSESGNVNDITGDYVIDVDNEGKYLVKISGQFPHQKYSASSGTDSSKIISVEQFGSIRWESLSHMFLGAYNMRYVSGEPIMDDVTDMSYMFRNSSVFNSDNISDWNTNSIINMEHMFENANSFNQPLNEWDTNNVESMESMFENASNFDQSLFNWDTDNVTNMNYMFENASSFNQDISNWCVENFFIKPTNFDKNAGFEGQTSLQPNWGDSSYC